ncbi:MAG: chromosome segregation protein SMC [Nanoarchaeota archaeon]|nr:chromosome segregation protein SMC [Nanoarchaeota archaeon]
MTKIKKLILRGFKSFPRRTELVFGDDFNCVLGPNGAGKSNILDALTFVLGRRSSKAMRAEKSANLIYNGGKTKNPAKDAEVSIVFCNKNKIFPLSAEDIVVSRLVKKDGASVYRLNGKKVTRNDITDLLSHARINPDGYNIIMQGDIVKFVEMATEERRKIIEDIAGIGLYEERKTKAMNELGRVEERLKEADIILTERRTYLRELKKDRDIALEFKGLHENLLKNKATLCKLQINKRTKLVADFDSKMEGYSQRISKTQEEIDKLNQKIEESNAKIKKINDEIEKKGEKEQVKLNREIEQLKIDLATSKTRIESYQNEIFRIKDRRKELEQNNSEINSKIESLNKEKQALLKEKAQKERQLRDLEKDIERFKKKNKFDSDIAGIEGEITKLDKESEELEETIQSLRQEQQQSLREKDQLEFKLASLDEQIDKVAVLEKENKAGLQNLKNMRKRFRDTSKELNKALSEDSKLAGELSQARQKLTLAQEKMAKLEVKDMKIKESMALDRAVSAILGQKNKIKGIHGTVSDLGEVSSKYSLALELAAGARIKSIVVDTDTTAAKCMKYLKQGKIGTATFLPLNKIKANFIPKRAYDLAKKPGAIDLAISLVKFNPQFKNVFHYVFGDTVVVKDIDTARKLGIGTNRMVTLEGDLVEVSGAMRGGYQSRRLGLGFKEKETASGLASAEEEVFALQDKISKAEKRRSGLDEKIMKLRQEKASVEGDIIKLEKTLHIEGDDLGDFKIKTQAIKVQIKQADKRVEKVVGELSNLNRNLAQMKIKRQQLRLKINEMRNPTVLAQLAAFEDKKNEMRESLIKIGSQISNFEGQISTILGPDIKRSLAIVEQNKKEEERFKKQVADFKENVKKNQETLKEKEKVARKFHSRFRGMFDQKAKFETAIRKWEKQGDEKDIVIKGIEQKSNAVSLDRAKYKAELAGFEREWEQHEEVELFKSKIDVNELEKEIQRLEAKKDDVGGVNLRALEIYDSVEGEYNQLLDKKEKLNDEKEDVLKLIGEIETSKKEIFQKTFGIVNKIFENFFSRLTTKGKAYLELENPDDPFSAGVEIKVKLTTNKFMDIKSLSGGEKTLTALAFIFAIQEHEPASFYILDEVDAALDKQNSEKLAHMLKRYCERAQYIVISHNDAIISEASYLYGISMNDQGVSQITTLEL